MIGDCPNERVKARVLRDSGGRIFGCSKTENLPHGEDHEHHSELR